MERPNTFGIYIQDKDGIILNNNTYKIAKGAYILLPCLSYPSMSFESYVNTTENACTPLTINSNLLDDLGPVKYSGPKRLEINLDTLIPIKYDTPTYEQYFGGTSTLNGNSVILADVYLLYNLWRFNHRYYLTDINPGESKPNFGLPINILINRKDMINKDIFTSAVPVVIESISPSGELIMYPGEENGTEEIYQQYKIKLVVTTYGT